MAARGDDKLYVVTCGDRVAGTAPGLREALALALERCSGGEIRVYRGELVARLTREEAASLIPQQAAEAGEARAAPAAAGAPGAAAARAAVVFDQMFKRFAEILDRELRDAPLEFHEIIGRGLEAPVRVSDRIVQQPARDDYDVLKLLEQLSEKYSLVIFFTGDRKLANQARTLPRVRVEFLPPGEVTGKEMAIKVMKRRILEALASRG